MSVLNQVRRLLRFTRFSRAWCAHTLLSQQQPTAYPSASRSDLTAPVTLESPLAEKLHADSDPPPDWNSHAEFFSFTRARFVCDEANEMAQRHVEFNMNALATIAAQAMGSSCIHVDKYPDRLDNKTFLLTMQNESQVVAKVPNPNAGLPHLTTASEVATIDFVSAAKSSIEAMLIFVS